MTEDEKQNIQAGYFKGFVDSLIHGTTYGLKGNTVEILQMLSKFLEGVSTPTIKEGN